MYKIKIMGDIILEKLMLNLNIMFQTHFEVHRETIIVVLHVVRSNEKTICDFWLNSCFKYFFSDIYNLAITFYSSSLLLEMCIYVIYIAIRN